MQPTIGRIVIYHPCNDRRDYVPQNGRPADVPAVIVAVWGNECVNLKVLTDGPNDVWVTSANFGTGERQWSWLEIIPTARPVDPELAESV